MIEKDGKPEKGESARKLGVRPGPGDGTDIPVADGKVKPGTGGMSVAPDCPENLPAHRRPPEFGGTGKDPVWKIDLKDLGDKLKYVQDKPNHGTIQPAKEMTYEEYKAALEALCAKFKKQTKD